MALTIVYGWYFIGLLPENLDDPVAKIGYQGAMFATVVIFVILFVVGMIILAALEGGYFWIANALLAGLVLSELVKGLVMLAAYRRGF